MAENRIKPCPFCGKAAAFVPSHNFYLIGCINPDCMHVEMRDKSAEKAIERWNRRMVEDELRDALDAANARIAELEAAADPEALTIAYGKGRADGQGDCRKRVQELEQRIAKLEGEPTETEMTE